MEHSFIWKRRFVNEYTTNLINNGKNRFILNGFRTHDELDVNFVEKNVAQRVSDKIMSNGNILSNANHKGVVGRMFSFLAENVNHMKISVFFCCLHIQSQIGFSYMAMNMQ